MAGELPKKGRGAFSIGMAVMMMQTSLGRRVSLVLKVAYRGLGVVLRSSLAEERQEGVSAWGRSLQRAAERLVQPLKVQPPSSSSGPSSSVRPGPHLSQLSEEGCPSFSSIRPTPPTGPPPRKNPYLAEEHPPIVDVRITLAPISITEIPPLSRTRPLEELTS